MQNVPSQAAQVLITVIPIVGIVMGGLVVLFFLLWNHKQRVLMIQQGMAPSRLVDLDTFSLFAGLLATGVGIVLTIFFLIVQNGAYSLLGGLIPLSVGLSLLVFYWIRRKPRAG